MYPDPANFLRRMLDENEGSEKDQFLGDPDWLSEMQYNAIIRYLRTIRTGPFQTEPFVFFEHALEGSGHEIG